MTPVSHRLMSGVYIAAGAPVASARFCLSSAEAESGESRSPHIVHATTERQI